MPSTVHIVWIEYLVRENPGNTTKDTYFLFLNSTSPLRSGCKFVINEVFFGRKPSFSLNSYLQIKLASASLIW